MVMYRVTRPSGEFDADAENAVEASKQVDAFLKEEAISQSRQSLADAPTWAKPFMYADSAAKVAADSATLGKLAPWVGDEGGVAGARDRLGNWAIPADIAGGLATPGFGIPGALAKIGGGALIRGLTKTAGAAGEGAAVGAIRATNDEDGSVSGGAGQGAIAGILGNTAANVIGKGINKASNWWKGVDDTLPKASLSNLPNKAPSAARRVEKAAIETEKRGGGYDDAAEIFGKLSTRGFDKAVHGDAVRGILQPDLATRGSGAVADWIKTKAQLAPVAVGGTLQDMKAMLATMVGLPAAGAIASYASKQGTKESIDELRRLMLKVPKAKDTIPGGVIDRFGRGGQRSILQKMREEDEDQY